MYPQFETLLRNLEIENPETAEIWHEEIDIVVHKLKFIPESSRPSVLMISDLRAFSQDFSVYTREAVQIAGGKWIDVSDLATAQKIIFKVHSPNRLYQDLPHLFGEGDFSEVPAVQNSQIFIIQNDDFGMYKDQLLSDLEILAEIIHPKYFIYGREGQDWIQFVLS